MPVPHQFLPSPPAIGLIAASFSGGQGKPGVESGPSALLASGLPAQLTSLGYTLHGDVSSAKPYAQTASANPNPNPSDPPRDKRQRNMKNASLVSSTTRALAETAYTHALAGRLVLTLGGDHSVAIGTVAGVNRAVREKYGERGVKGVALVYVDAHADINTPETSGSGNVHGMPVAFLTGLAQASARAEADQQQQGPEDGKQGEKSDDVFDWLDLSLHGVPLAQLVYVGLRDVDAGEKQILRANGIRAYSMHEIDRFGIGEIMERVLAHIDPDCPIHLSFDVDALDPLWAPSTGVPVRGGLTLREGDYIAECMAATGRLVGVDLVEVNPFLGLDGKEGGEGGEGAEMTVRAAGSLVKCALGDTLL